MDPRVKIRLPGETDSFRIRRRAPPEAEFDPNTLPSTAEAPKDAGTKAAEGKPPREKKT